MTKKQTRNKSYRPLAYILFYSGLTLLLISYLIQLVFINGTDFKQTYRQKQYDQCITKNNPEVCAREFDN